MHTQPDGLPLLLILCVAVLAPLAASATRRIKAPVIVLEVGLGILVGPHVLGWASLTPFDRGTVELRAGLLFFLAGFEVDLRKIRGRPITLAVMGWFLSLALISATALPLVVAITEIGVSTSQMRSETAAAVVGAGMPSVLLYPLAAIIFRKTRTENAADV